MPKIVPFEAPDLNLRPSEVGVEATAAAARRGGAFFNQAAGELTSVGHMAGSAIREAGDAAVAYVDHQQIQHGGLVAAQTHLALNQAWDKLKKDNPNLNDQSLAAKFNTETLEPTLQKFNENFTTQRSQQWAQGRADHLRNIFFQTTAADMSSRAGAAVMQNAQVKSNLNQRTVYDHPEQLDDFIRPDGIIDQDTKADIAANPGLKAEQQQAYRDHREQEKKKMVFSAGQSVAEKANGDPQKVKDFADRYGQWIDPQTEQKIQKSAQGYHRADLQQQRADQQEQRRQALTGFYRDTNQLEMSTLPDEPGKPDKVPPDYFKNLQAIANKYQGVDPVVDARIGALIHRGETLGRKLDETKQANLNRISQGTQRELYGRITADYGNPNRMASPKEIDDAYARGDLTWPAHNQLMTDFQQARSPEGEKLVQRRTAFFKSMNGVIDGGRGKGDLAGNSNLGAQRIDQAIQDAKAREQQLISKGDDPHSIYDRKSPNFFDVSQYRVSAQEATKYDADLAKADAERAKANAPPPSPGIFGNLFGPETTTTRVDVIDIPKDMSPEEAIRKYGGKRVRLPGSKPNDPPITLPTAPLPSVPQSR